MRRYIALLIVVITLSLVLAGCETYQLHGTPYQPPQPAPPITGLNLDGANFNLSQLQGKPVLLFFGFTNCPDVCPTTLAEMRVVRQRLGDKAEQMAFVYVSVDPERDTVARLKEYIPQFDPAFYGVHVNSIDLEAIKQGYGLVAEKVYTDPKDPSKGYSIDHTARTYLVGPAGRLATSYPYGTDLAEVQKDVEYLIR
jgi:protein SCO1/2